MYDDNWSVIGGVWLVGMGTRIIISSLDSIISKILITCTNWFGSVTKFAKIYLFILFIY